MILVTVYLQCTRHGFEIRVVGEQEKTAEYLGVPVKRVIVRTMLISGAIAGIAGMLKISGADFNTLMQGGTLPPFDLGSKTTEPAASAQEPAPQESTAPAENTDEPQHDEEN